MKVVIMLDHLLDQKKMSQRKLARLTEIRHPSINEMCRNQAKHIPLENLAKICEVLGCDIPDVLKLEKE